MATALTTTQIQRFRRKIGDTNLKPAFDDEAIQDIWQEAEEDWDTAVLIAYEELLGNAWRFADYTQNQSEEKKNQIFKNLERMVDRAQAKVSSRKKGRNQVRMGGLKPIPPRRKDVP